MTGSTNKPLPDASTRHISFFSTLRIPLITGLILVSVFSLFAQNEEGTALIKSMDKYNAGNYKGALIDLQQIVEQDPENARAYLYLGRSYFNLKEYKASMVHLNRSVWIQPSSMAYKERGKLKALMEDYRGSIDDFGQAIELDSTFSDAFYNRGLSYERIREYQQAYSDFTQVIFFNPKDYEAFFQRGMVMHAMGEKEKGCRDFSKSAELGNFDAYETIKKKCN